MAETTRSGPHRRVERYLERAGIMYESEYTAFAPYALDIYLPDVHAAIEVDGPHHYPKRDAGRDRVLLERYSVPTLRLSVQFVTGTSERDVMAAIEDFMAEAGQTTAERKERYQCRFSRNTVTDVGCSKPSNAI